jgi:hypothetical protein
MDAVVEAALPHPEASVRPDELPRPTPGHDQRARKRPHEEGGAQQRQPKAHTRRRDERGDREKRRHQEDNSRRAQSADAVEARGERPRDASERAPSVHVANGPTSGPAAVNGELGHDRADRAHRRGREQEDERHVQRDALGERSFRKRVPVHPTAHPVLQDRDREADSRTNEEERREQLARIDPVGEPAAGVVAHRHSSQDDADHTRPVVEPRPHVHRHHPARRHLHAEEAEARDEGEAARQDSLQGGRLPIGVHASRISEPAGAAKRAHVRKELDFSRDSPPPVQSPHATPARKEARPATGGNAAGDRSAGAPATD